MEDKEYSWYVVSADTGQVVDKVENGGGIKIFTPKEIKRNKEYDKRIQIKGYFKKMMVQGQEFILERLKNSYAAYYALGVLCKYIVPGTNYIMKDDEKFSAEELAAEMEIVPKRAYDYLKTLKEANIICKVKTKSGIVWAMNPYLYCNGDSCVESVIKAFEKQAEELAEKKKKQNS